MRRYRLVFLCSLASLLGFGACSLDPVPVLPGSDRDQDRTAAPDGQATVTTTGGSTTGAGGPNLNTGGTGPITINPEDSGTTGEAEMPETPGDGAQGSDGEGGAAGDTGDTGDTGI